MLSTIAMVSSSFRVSGEAILPFYFHFYFPSQWDRLLQERICSLLSWHEFGRAFCPCKQTKSQKLFPFVIMAEKHGDVPCQLVFTI